MEIDLIKNDFFLESTRTYLEKIFNLNYMLLMEKNYEEYVLKSLFIQKIPTLRSILFNNKIVNMNLLLIPLMRQKYEMAQEKFQNLIKENSKLQEEKIPPLSSAKIRLIQFKILSEIQLAIFDYEYITAEKDLKKRKVIGNKITREFELLIFNIQLAKDEDALYDNMAENFFKNFICEMPDSHLIEDLLCEIFTNLEFDPEMINKFNDKCKEHKDKGVSGLDIKEKEIGNYSSSLGKKRNFNKMQAETLDKKLKDEVSLENNMQFSIKSKISKTIDTYFPKNSDREELGFKNIIKKISAGNSVMPIKDQNLSIRNHNHPALSYAINKNSQIFTQSITPHSLMSQFPGRLNDIIHKEISDSNLNNVTLPSEDFDDSQGNIDSDKKKNSDKETSEKDTQDEAIYTHQENSISNIHYNTNKIISDTNKSNDPLHFNNFNRFNSSLSLSLNNVNTYNKEHRQIFSDYNFKTEMNNLINSNSKSINSSYALNSGFKMNNLDSSFASTLNEISSMTINNTRSNSNNMTARGINSRLANIVNMPKAKKQTKIPSKSKKDSNEKIEEFFDKIQNKMSEEGLNKRKDSKIVSKEKDRNNSDTMITVVSNPLKKIIHNRFYLKEKDLKSPSPINVECPKYSKRGKNIIVASPYENIDLNHTSNISATNQLESTNIGLLSTSNTNSNISSLEGRFDMLKTTKQNKSNASSIIKKTPDISTGMSFNSVGECNNLIILNKFKNKAISSNNDNCSDDEILVLATPTKPCENIKFGRRSPNSAVSSKVNLCKLFNQFKKNK